MSDRTCSVDGCSKVAKCRGRCRTHYHEFWRKNLNPNSCSIPGCQRKRAARGWCGTHYSQFQRTGDPLGSLRADPEDRFFSRLAFGDWFEGTRCLLWTGPTHGVDGYGLFIVGRGGRHVAHRWLYERWVGTDLAGLHLHHRCHVKRCVNPTHLEPLTVSEHTRRHIEERGPYTHCPAGHEYDEANTYVHPTKGYKCCRACHREQERNRLRRLRAAKLTENH